MSDTLSGYRFVITGGAAGIGAATAELAAQRGAEVVIGGPDAGRTRRTAEEINVALSGRGGAGTVHATELDVGDPDSVTSFMASAAETLGGIDVLHNNAGVADAMLTDRLSIEELPLEVWDRVMNVNVRGTFLCTRAALPHLRRSSRASVVNIGSVGSVTGFPHTLAYGASKGAVALLTKNLAIELAPDNIRVNCCSPGVTETRMTLNYLNSAEDPAAARAAMASSHLVPRLGLPVDIARVVCFLAGPESAFINGEMILADGGQLAWRGNREQA
jgi:NAD(P)-dependent dehydrogenase (short-subunit alcohol dehydrogenase family)